MSAADSPAPPAASPIAPVDVVGRHGRLVRRTALISVLTLMSRIIGFVRESLAASIFGHASPINDAFVTAWRVPNLFRSLLGEGAMSTSLQTAITRADAQQGLEAGRALFHAIVRVVSWILVGLCAVVMIAVHFMPDAMPITGFAWLGDHPAEVRELTVRMMPFVVFVCLSAVASGALNVRGHFVSPSLAPVVMNLWWITALFIVAREFGWSRAPGVGDAQEWQRQMQMTRWLAWFVLGAGLILVLVQLPALKAKGLLSRPKSVPGDALVASNEHVWMVLKTSAPLAMGAAVYQVNVMVDGFMAVSLLPNGGPTALYYATRIQQFPMSLVSIAATSAVFPALTALGQQRALREVRALHDRTHLAIAFVAIPATIGLLLFAEPVVSVCFEHGAFGPEGVVRGGSALRFLTLAILPAGAAGLVARTFYALGDFKTPVRISILMLVSNVVLNVVLVAGFGMDVGGVALATALTACGNLALLWPGLRRRLGLPQGERNLLRRLVAITAAALVAGLVARGTYDFALYAGGPHRALALLAAIALCISVYALVSHGLRIPEWHHLIGRLRRPRA
ncbi:MAG: murein biosynthesis integral membrane protein MurJ [Planctomycetota bacterium]